MNPTYMQAFMATHNTWNHFSGPVEGTQSPQDLEQEAVVVVMEVEVEVEVVAVMGATEVDMVVSSAEAVDILVGLADLILFIQEA
jgi:hypothetical protein